MRTSTRGRVRPPIHLLASESDLVAALALSAEHQQPVVAAMLLEEIERAELHGADEIDNCYIRLNSCVTFMDDKTRRMREVQLVLPANANIAEDRISILTPMGAALYGLADGASISSPDLDGNRAADPGRARGAAAGCDAGRDGVARPVTPDLRRPRASRFGPDR